MIFLLTAIIFALAERLAAHTGPQAVLFENSSAAKTFCSWWTVHRFRLIPSLPSTVLVSLPSKGERILNDSCRHRSLFLWIIPFQDRPQTAAVLSPVQGSVVRIKTVLTTSKLPANRLLLLNLPLPGFSRSFGLKGDMISADWTLQRTHGHYGALFPATAKFFHLPCSSFFWYTPSVPMLLADTSPFLTA